MVSGFWLEVALEREVAGLRPACMAVMGACCGWLCAHVLPWQQPGCVPACSLPACLSNRCPEGGLDRGQDRHSIDAQLLAFPLQTISDITNSYEAPTMAIEGAQFEKLAAAAWGSRQTTNHCCCVLRHLLSEARLLVSTLSLIVATLRLASLHRNLAFYPHHG